MAEEEKGEIPKIRTFKTDTETYMQQSKTSQLEMTAKTYAAQKGLRALRESLPQFNYKKIIYISAGVLILAAAGYFGYLEFVKISQPQTPVVIQPQAPPKFLEVETSTDLSFSSGDMGSLTNNIKSALLQQFRYNSINYLKIKKNNVYIDAGEFIKALSWSPPKAFLDNLEPDFNTLIVYQNTANAPVFIFKTKNFAKTFGALLEWESRTEGGMAMWQDLKPFIDLSGVDAGALYRRPFEDDMIKNNDARVFKTKEGKLLLEYVFFSKKFAIISPSRDALDLVLSRFLALPPR